MFNFNFVGIHTGRRTPAVAIIRTHAGHFVMPEYMNTIKLEYEDSSICT